MDADGVSRRTIGLNLCVASGTVWNYLQDDKPDNDKQSVWDKDKPIIELDFTGREDLYSEICNIAENHLREPHNQILWWLMNTDFDKLQKGLTGE